MSDNKNDLVPIIKLPTNERIQELSKQFYDEFGREPEFIARVPGRVNLIGEHIDYCGYPVLPMALEQDILIAVSLIVDRKLCIRNTNAKYENIDMEIKLYDEIIISADPNGKPFWYNYVLCGVKGALEHLDNKVDCGLNMFIDGNIPPASGLSSSSALVSAACLAFLYAQKAVLNKTEIAGLCARCERYIGTQGGGMDQAIAFLAEKYCAQYITWNPTKATKVVLPEDASFVVAHSLAEVNKAATNDYNRRVTECRLAAKILSLPLSTEDHHHTIITLGQVQKLLNKTLEEMAALVEEKFPNDIYTKHEICKMLQVTEDELNNYYLTPNTRQLTEFKLKQRALHVYEEAGRVEAFRKTCGQTFNGNVNGANGTNGTSVNEADKILNNLGALMTESHTSLKNLYECSHENLDRLVEISMKLNVHSRLTGAGWGGCIVALCSKDRVKEYIKILEDEFYVKHCNIDKSKAKSYVFATAPNFGAVIYV